MKLGNYDIGQILEKTIFDKALFKTNFPIVAIAILLNFVLFFILSKFSTILFFAEPIIQLITGLLLIYVLLNATTNFANNITNKSQNIKMASLSEFWRFVLVIMLYLIFAAIAFAILFLFGFIAKIPVVGIYIFGFLAPIFIALSFTISFFVLINGKLISALFCDNRNSSFKEIGKKLLEIPLKNPVKIIFNMMLSFIIIILPLIAALALLSGIAYVVFFTIWQVVGLNYLLSLSIQGGSNFIAFFLMIAQALIISLGLTFLLNSFAGISYSIFKDLK